MNTKQFISKLFAIFAMVIVFQACVEDDDFDIPPIDEDAAENACAFENFEGSLTNYQIIDNSDNGVKWSVGDYSGNSYISASAFNKTKLVDTWFVAGVDFDTAIGFSFETLSAYYTGDVLSVLYSTDYDESGNVDDATWVDITTNFAFSQSIDGYDSNWVPSGLYEFNGLSGKGYIAMRYKGIGSGATTLMEIDNFMVVSEDGSGTCVYDIANIGAGSNLTPNNCVNEDFSSYAKDFSEFTSYENIAYTGSRTWQVKDFGGNNYIQMSANQANGDIKSYFVVPVDFTNADSFSFKSKDGYNNGDALSVFYTTDYTPGGDIETATLNDITSEFTIATGSTSGYASNFTESGSYGLDSISGNGYIVFKYEGNGNGVTTTMQLDEIMVVDNEDTNCTTDGGTTPIFETKGGSNATPLACLAENFESFEDETEEFPTYENIAYTGGRFWRSDSYNNNKYLKLSAFQAAGEVKSYFVVPVNFDEADTFSFKTQDRYNNGDVLAVYYTTDHTIGSDIETATLSDITSEFTIATGTTDGASQPFVESGEFSLASISGNGYIVFKYEGNGNGTTTTMHIDEIIVTDNEDANCNNDGGTTDKECSTQDFETFAVGDTEIASYQLISTEGGNVWNIKEHNNNKYIQTRGYNGDATEEDWFILGVNFDIATSFSFETKDGYNNGEGLKVMYSTNYDANAGEPNTANWTDITSSFTISTGNTSGYANEFLPSGDYDLSTLTGNGFIAFKFEGGTSSVTTTYQIDNIVFNSDADGNCKVDLTQPTTGGGTTTSTLLISEIADPKDAASARFVELYNAGTETIDLAGWKLLLYSNANTTAGGTTDLSGTITPGSTFVIATNATEFETTYGFAPNLSGSVNSNGDDNFELVDSNGNVVDIFGRPGEDGTGTDHEFLDGRAYRNADITVANSTYNSSEWTITTPVNTTDAIFTPGQHPDVTTTTTIVNNGSFENWTAGVLDNWSSEDGTTITEETTTVAEGSKAAKVEVITDAQTSTDFRQTVSVEAGKTYTISVQVYQLDNESRARLFVDGYQGYSDPELLNQWQTVTFEYVADTTIDIEVGLRFYDISSAFDGSSTMIIDDFQMTEM